MIENEKLPKLPKGWTNANLGDVADYINGRAFKPSEWEQHGRPILRIQNLTKSTNVVNRYPKPIEEKYIIQDGQLLISWSATLDAYIYRGEEAVLNQHIFKVEPFIDKMFLYHLIKAYINNLKSKIHGSGMQHITKNKFEELTIPLPPYNEQKRIVEKIEELFTKLDASVRELKSVKQSLNFYRNSVLKNAFFNSLIKLDTSWKKYEINDISKKIQYGLTSNSGMDYSGPKYLRITDIQNQKVDWDSVPFAKKTEDLDKYYLKDNDLVFARTGATVGKSFLIKDCPKNAVFASYLIRIIPEPTKILPELLWYYFQSSMYWTQISQKKLGIGQPNVNGQILSKLTLQLPVSIQAQIQLFQEIDSHFSVINKLEETVNNVLIKQEQLGKSILKNAFEGKLVQQNFSDEPAEVLLKRIKNEKYEQMRLI